MLSSYLFSIHYLSKGAPFVLYGLPHPQPFPKISCETTQHFSTKNAASKGLQVHEVNGYRFSNSSHGPDSIAVLLCLWFLFYLAADRRPNISTELSVSDIISGKDQDIEEPTSDWQTAHESPYVTESDARKEDELPEPERPRRYRVYEQYLTVTTMIKNKRRWLREWIEFYLMMGVDHFIVYDNNSTDYPLDILQSYIDQNVITYIPWPPATVPPP